jgi:hypothetical protein
MEDKLIDILQNFRNDENYNELNAVDDILRLFTVVGRSEQLRAFKEFLQSEYHLPVSNRMIDEFEQK